VRHALCFFPDTLPPRQSHPVNVPDKLLTCSLSLL
jgi:hypothetical protein